MNIQNIEIADFCEYESTVSVRAEDEKGVIETFHVQTTDGLFRSDLGCWVLTSDSSDNIDFEDYPNFDLDEIIEAAERFMSKRVKEQETPYFIDGKRVGPSHSGQHN